MVYIYKKIVGNKNYYYLRASERKGNKILSKDIAYLGDSIKKAKQEIKNIQKYKQEIKKSYRKINLFLESNHYLEIAKEKKYKTIDLIEKNIYEIEACKLHYDKDFKKQDKLTQKQLLDNFVIDFTYNTTSIEGNTIGLKEVQNLFEEGLTPKNKTLREIYDLQNTKAVFESLDLKKDISDKLIVKVHDDLLINIDQRKGYRTKEVLVKGGGFSSTPWQFISGDINELISWYKENKKLHPLVLATIFHHKFEKIHPFFDGNGRTGRMLMNFILLKNNYPPVIIRKKFRNDYLDSLSAADEENIFSKETKQYKKLIEFVASEFVNNYWNIFL
jgi:Fic family protein